jgi:hypothetical protein
MRTAQKETAAPVQCPTKRGLCIVTANEAHNAHCQAWSPEERPAAKSRPKMVMPQPDNCKAVVTEIGSITLSRSRATIDFFVVGTV